MSKSLLIVESPNKIKKIQAILGSNFIVSASVGHIRDLKPIKDGLSIDINNGFKPIYAVTKDKLSVVKRLKSQAAQCDKVYIATDDDREGEAIGWHIVMALGIPIDSPRVKFGEITKKEIQNVMANKVGKLDMKWVYAQEARRMIDRIVGSEGTPVVWAKVKGAKSVGRVQSPTTRVIVDREREIMEHIPTSVYKISALGNKDNIAFQAKFVDVFDKKNTVIDILKALEGQQFTVNNVETSPAKRAPPQPFTTSKFQQAASSKLKLSPEKSMQVAQSLFAAGHITYMRTDSPALSEDTIDEAKQLITNEYGENYSNSRQFKSKDASAQEAHVAISPTHLNEQSVGSNDLEQKVYTLIRNQVIASQMSSARFNKTTIEFEALNYKAITEGSVITFEGFLKVMGSSKADDILPSFNVGENFIPLKIVAKQSFTKGKSRYTEASLINELEKLGIGRPSTFASMISTVQARGYVFIGDAPGNLVSAITITQENSSITESTKEETIGADKKKLMPTKVGFDMVDFMFEYFPDIIDYGYTSKLEERFDEIAKGSIEREEYMREFYKQFHPTVENALASAKSIASGALEVVGVCPKTGADVTLGDGKYGPCVKLMTDKPKFANIPKHIKEVDIKTALTLLSLPREVGEFGGEVIITAYGKNGAYLRRGKADYINLEDKYPESITTVEAVAKYEAQAQVNINNPVCVECGSPTKRVQGKFGEFLSCSNYPKCKAKQPKI